MRSAVSIALSGLIAFGVIAPSMSTSAEAKNRGAKIAAGVVLGAAALALIAGNAKADERKRRWAQHCRSLYNRCTNGSRYACEKYETGGCTE